MVDRSGLCTPESCPPSRTSPNVQVLHKIIDGKKREPYERVVIEVPAEFEGTVMQHLQTRRGEFMDVEESMVGTGVGLYRCCRYLV